MPPPAGPGGPAAPPPVAVSDTAVARIAAHTARQVPGVLALRPDLTQSMARLAQRLVSGERDSSGIPTDGVSATVTEGTALVHVALVTHFGRNCREVAQSAQDAVARAVTGYTGLRATVNVTITDVELG